MGFKELCGEVRGKDLIQVGDIVKVLYGTHWCIGRLNKSSKEEIKVGIRTIKVEEIIKIEEHKV